ncbi:hypothetical protein FIBSPDRAFT_1038268 [Athelia psychrophila]|uniref:Uncharacterized protein n=1 Tax=Athelia psychrophila TaxID=1759441 RepID=A0A166T6M9_9AGAM|nr:hypothetical protein FIBSPDRAFT_1038268 [Fibularhizoctonia sp. CBS 109695]
MGDTQAESLPLNTLTQATIGPAFIGFIISLSLNGISIAQSVFYYRSFPRDGRVTKLIVLLLNIAELAQTSVLSNMFWDMLICSRLPRAGADASPKKSPTNPWQVKASFMVTAFIALLVQGFFCLRVWRVSLGKVVLIAAISVTALLQLAAMIYLVTHADKILDPQLNKPGSVNNYLFSLAFVGNIVCDGIVAGSLTYYFRSYRLGMPRFVTTAR